MDVIEKGCTTCEYGELSSADTPCRRCLDVMYQINVPYTKWRRKIDETAPDNNNYDQHYISAHQPIEVMQANMTHDEFVGFLKGNIIKYVCRLGKKDEPAKEAAKIRRYAEWLEQAVSGQTVDPRK